PIRVAPRSSPHAPQTLLPDIAPVVHAVEMNVRDGLIGGSDRPLQIASRCSHAEDPSPGGLEAAVKMAGSRMEHACAGSFRNGNALDLFSDFVVAGVTLAGKHHADARAGIPG